MGYHVGVELSTKNAINCCRQTGLSISYVRKYQLVGTLSFSYRSTMSIVLKCAFLHWKGTKRSN